MLSLENTTTEGTIPVIRLPIYNGTGSHSSHLHYFKIPHSNNTLNFHFFHVSNRPIVLRNSSLSLNCSSRIRYFTDRKSDVSKKILCSR